MAPAVTAVPMCTRPQGDERGLGHLPGTTILNRLYDKGLVDDGFMLEVLASHTNVVTQRGFDERGYGGFNPYALGFAMFSDLRRICEAPTDEDRAGSRTSPDATGGRCSTSRCATSETSRSSRSTCRPV